MACSYTFFDKDFLELFNSMYTPTPDNWRKIMDVWIWDWKFWTMLRNNPRIKFVDWIEIFAPYIDIFAVRPQYRNIFVMDVMDFVNRQDYDTVIIWDVLEHLTVEDAQKLLERLKDKDVIVQVPYLYTQPEFNWNKNELHIQDDLTNEIFLQRYPQFDTIKTNDLLGLYIYRWNSSWKK